MTRAFILDQSNVIQAAMQDALPHAIACENEVSTLNNMVPGQSSLVLLRYQESVTVNLIRVLLKANPQANIVVVAPQLAEQKIIDCVLAGAKGYQNADTLKDYSSRLLAAIKGGEAWVSRKLVAKLIDYWSANHLAA
jgi:DNA-binding NarL/FixJ family response regulator